MAQGIGPPLVVVEAFTSRGRVVCRGPHPSRSWGSSRGTGTSHMRRRLVVRGGDLSDEVPLVGNWSEMLPTSREHDNLPVRVLTGVLGPPLPESWPSRCQSWPSRCQSWPSHCQWCLITFVLGEIILPSKGALIWALVTRTRSLRLRLLVRTSSFRLRLRRGPHVEVERGI
jgi:hypothetical protein